MKNWARNLIFGIAGIATLVGGCSKKSDEDFKKTIEYKGFTAIAETTPKSRRVYLGKDIGGKNLGSYDDARPSNKNLSYWIIADDFDKDGRFDDIKLFNVAKGHPIELFANLSDLENAYFEAEQNGTDEK